MDELTDKALEMYPPAEEVEHDLPPDHYLARESVSGVYKMGFSRLMELTENRGMSIVTYHGRDRLLLLPLKEEHRDDLLLLVARVLETLRREQEGESRFLDFAAWASEKLASWRTTEGEPA